MKIIMERNMSGKTNFQSEFFKMSSAEFATFAMHNHVAPRSMGSVKTRLGHAQRVLARRKWSANRVRDLWYRDPRASEPKWDEIRDLEELTGLQYARQELKEVDDLILRADRLLDGPDADFYRPFVTAFRALFGASRSSRTEGDDR
jgi:hypothetical protein